MKQVGFYALLGGLGAVLGTRYLSEAAAFVFPETGGEHSAWYASRAAGMASYLMLWLATVAGALMSSAWFDGIVNRARLLAMHQAATFGGLLLGVGHALVLIPDNWTQFGLIDLFVPFASYYEPTQAALGTMALYLFALVTFSFWMRGAIGIKLWRVIHFSAFLALAGAFWHGISIGTDSSEPWAMAIYFATSLTLVMAVGIRLTYQRPTKRKAPVAKEPRTA